MKKTTLILALVLFFVQVFAQKNETKDLTAQFDQLIGAQFRPNEPGAAVLVTKKGQIIYKKAFGMANIELDVPMQTDNVFRIGSITKQFTAIAILQLMEAGKLNLQDEITKFLPDYPTSGYKITIEHLLTHTSGIANKTDLPDSMAGVDFKPADFIEHFKNQPMNFAPGTNWAYSNMGYFLLGYIIEKITGKTYAEYLEEHFFKPLNMDQSLYANDYKIVKKRAAAYTRTNKGFENPGHLSMSIPYAAGSIQSTVEDLFKWNQAVHSYKLVKKETLDKAFTKYKLTDGRETAYGYGWRLGNVYESPSIWHGGLINGFIAMEIYLPKEDVFVAVLTNCDRSAPDAIAPRLASLATGKPFEYKEAAIENIDSKGYTGVYENGKGQQRIITVADNQLYGQLNRSPKSKWKPYQNDMFFLDATQTIEFQRNKKGAIEKLITKSLAGNEVWVKTDKPMPAEDGIRVDEKILNSYVGVYEVTPVMSFTVTREKDKLFLQATRQEKLQIFAETESKFFLKVNDAQIEFVKDGSGKIIKAILYQGGRRTDAMRVK